MTNAGSKVLLCLALFGAPIAAGCAAPEETDAQPIIASSGNSPLIIYGYPYGAADPTMAAVPNPIGYTASASARGYNNNGNLRIKLTLQGMPAGRTFGAHLHKLPCDDPAKAGGHYQHNAYPQGVMASDPNYANTSNEMWLDFATDSYGQGGADVTVAWMPRPNEAKAIIIHQMASGVGGLAGPKLACLPVAFAY